MTIDATPKETYLGVSTEILSDFVTQYARHKDMITQNENLEIIEVETEEKGITVFRCYLHLNRKGLN